MKITITIPTIVLRFCKWSLLPVFALALMLTWSGGDSAGPAEAQEDPNLPDVGEGAGYGPTVEFRIGVPEQCDTSADHKKCLVAPGDNFTLDVFLDDISDLPDKDAKEPWLGGGGYTEVAVRVDYSWNLSVKKGEGGGAGMGEGNTSISAPEGSPCFDGFDFAYNTGNQLWVHCVVPGKGPTESDYTGVLFEVDFACPTEKSKETITLVMGPDVNWLFSPEPPIMNGATAAGFVTNPWGKTGQYGTWVLNENGEMASGNYGEGDTETLVINCDNPWPWDLTGDGLVRSGDILEVVQHYRQDKP